MKFSGFPSVTVAAALVCLLLCPVARGAEEGIINFSFDQVDVRSFVKLAGDITGRKFVVADDVAGKITIVSPPVRQAEVYPLFVSILESAGCAVVEEGDIVRVVSLPERSSPLAPVVGADEQTPASGVVTKVIRLQNVTASEMRKLLESQIAGGKRGAVGTVDETNHLIITDTAETIRRVEKIVAEVDRPGLSRTTEIVALEYAGAEDLAEQITLALTESAGRGDQLKRRLPAVGGSADDGRRPASIVASPQANRLILVGTPSQIRDIRELIAKMDVDSPSGAGRLNAIFLRYIEAEEAAKSINSVLGNSEGAAGAAAQKRKISIEASSANNALLVEATPGDFEVVRKLVDQLDIPATQVLVGVVIAEMTTSDGLDIGLQMAALDMPAEVGDTVVQGAYTLSDSAEGLMSAIQQGVFPGGITVGVAQGVRIDSEGKVVVGYPGMFNIDAVKKDSNFRLVSETVLEVQNNREASVSIVNEIPILESTISAGAGTARDVIQNIKRVEVGIKLTLTPHIIPGGEVQMVLNPTIEAVIDPGPTGTEFTPTIARRTVTTTVTVPDGDTIVIAGLTREDEIKSVRKVPVLGSIPVLGWLFRHTANSLEKTNMLILVTPRIVTDRADAQEVMRDWNDKTGLTPP